MDDTKEARRQEVVTAQPQAGGGGKFFTIFVDDVEYHFDHEPVTGAEIMQRAGIPVSVGINVIEEDGTQRAVSPDEELDLKPGRRFKKAPRFKRG